MWCSVRLWSSWKINSHKMFHLFYLLTIPVLKKNFMPRHFYYLLLRKRFMKFVLLLQANGVLFGGGGGGWWDVWWRRGSGAAQAELGLFWQTSMYKIGRFHKYFILLRTSKNINIVSYLFCKAEFSMKQFQVEDLTWKKHNSIMNT